MVKFLSRPLFKRTGLASLLLVLALSCTASIDYMRYVDKVERNLRTGNFEKAGKSIDKARKKEIYKRKDRLLFYLDKGIVLHYAGKWAESNQFFDKAEKTIEALFTKSVSQMAMSYMLNDNVTDYYGEIYENIYLNVFKALNYHHLGQEEAALVEIRKVNIKLRELDDKYGQAMSTFAEENEVDVPEDENQPFYSDALAHYLSEVFYTGQRDYDQGRISRRNLHQAWRTQKNIYDFALPDFLTDEQVTNWGLRVIAFSGTAPKKRAYGGMITTYKDQIGISDLSVPIALPNIPFPGSKPGYHFKFELPVLENRTSAVEDIHIRINGREYGTLELLENMGQIAEYTFEAHKMMIYLKTVLRTVAKGIAAAEAKKKLKKEAEADKILGAFIDMAVDASVDATERADLRCWSTMPQNCYVGQFDVPKGKVDVEAVFVSASGQIIARQRMDQVEVGKGVQLLEFVSLN